MNRNPDARGRAPVAIVGAGPVGLALALGLARQGVRSVVLERKDRTSERSKAPAIHVRTREVLRLWGVEERFLEAGTLVPTVTMHSVVPGRRPLLSLDFSDLEDEAHRPGLLVLEQGRTEALLLEAVRETGRCEVRFSAEAVRLAQDREGARVTFREGGKEHTLDAGFVVGCDGAGSFVRGALELPFDGMTYSVRPMLADVRVRDERDGLPYPRAWTGSGGFAFAVRLSPGLWRLVHLAPDGDRPDEVPDEEVHERVERLLGPGPAEVVWASRFRIHRRASPRFRVGRVLLAGDAAHVHSPASGLGMNGGIHDAHNLAWKLAHALRGAEPEPLLESYEVERREVIVEDVSRYTDLLTRAFIQVPAVVRRAAFLLVRGSVRIPALRRWQLRRTAMLDLDYPGSTLLDGKALSAGVRLPNPPLRSPAGEVRRLYDLLPEGPAMLDVADDRDFREGLPVEHGVRIGRGGYEDPTGLLRGLLKNKDGWVLVRPDAHVAWARHEAEGMEEAVQRALGWAAGTSPAPAR